MDWGSLACSSSVIDLQARARCNCATEVLGHPVLPRFDLELGHFRFSCFFHAFLSDCVNCVKGERTPWFFRNGLAPTGLFMMQVIVVVDEPPHAPVLEGDTEDEDKDDSLLEPTEREAAVVEEHDVIILDESVTESPTPVPSTTASTAGSECWSHSLTHTPTYFMALSHTLLLSHPPSQFSYLLLPSTSSLFPLYVTLPSLSRH